MARIIMAPGKYVQGMGELGRLGEYAKLLGDAVFCISSPSGLERMTAQVEEGCRRAGMRVVLEAMTGECSQAEVDRLVARMKEAGCDIVAGIGGGKILDTAKAVAYFAHTPVIVAPTSASTDAPCSALSVLYQEDGVFDRYLSLRSNPDLVLVDTGVICTAPPRLLVAGMGDALSTWFEARATAASGGRNSAGGQVSRAALGLARLCYETLLEDGPKAKLAVERQACTPAVENVIEANIYLSGLGFESGGLAAAHAIHNGLTVLPGCRGSYHGEKVAFGTLCQLVLEHADQDTLDTVLAFCRQVGLPVTLAALGIGAVKHDGLMAAARAACASGSGMEHMPEPVLPEQVAEAILTADELGRKGQA